MVENYSKSEKQAMEGLALIVDVADSYEEDSVKDYSQEELNVYKDSVNLGDGEKLVELGIDGYMSWNETPGNKKMEGARSLRKDALEYYGKQLLGRLDYHTRFDSTGTGEIVYDSEKGFTLIDSKKNEFPVKSDKTFNFDYFFPEFSPGLMGGVTERVKNPKMDKWKKIGALAGAGLLLAAPLAGVGSVEVGSASPLECVNIPCTDDSDCPYCYERTGWMYQCINDDVYRCYASCTSDGKCSILDGYCNWWCLGCGGTLEFVEDCGEDELGKWAYYWNGKNIRRQRDCVDRGCSGGSCYENSYTEDEPLGNYSFLKNLKITNYKDIEKSKRDMNLNIEEIKRDIEKSKRDMNLNIEEIKKDIRAHQQSFEKP